MKTENRIKNIVFDFGGVLLDIDYQRTYDALSSLLNIDFEIESLPEDVKMALTDFETGKLNVETFIWNLQRLANKDVPTGQSVIKAWNAMLIGWNPAKFDFLLSLRKKYRIYLLSNTNELHLDWVRTDLKKNHGIIEFDNVYFDKTYYSHEVGMKKPDKKIYEFVERDQCLDPAQTLFIDDLLPNLEGCMSLGWHIYHHDPKEDLMEIFRDELKLI